MRPSPDASLALWPTRILRPWLVASAAGFSIGSFLLSFEPPETENSYSELPPRAALYDTRPTLVPDPFAPSASLAAPPDAPAPLAASLPSETEAAVLPLAE